MIHDVFLVHRSGNLTCDVADASFTSNWGCGLDSHAESWTALTSNTSKTIEFEGSYGIIPAGYTPQNAFLVTYSSAFGPVFTMEDGFPTNLQIWYKEDLENDDEDNNGGEHCVDVLAYMENMSGNNLAKVQKLPDGNTQGRR